MGPVEYPEPNTMDHVSYFDATTEANRRLHTHVGSLAVKAAQALDPDTYALCTVGSDARLEKGPVSPFEIMLAIRSDNERARFLPVIDGIIRAEDGSAFDPLIEFKSPEMENVCESTFYQDGEQQFSLYSPNRLLDAKVICGSDELQAQIKGRLPGDMQGTPGKKRIRDVRDRFRVHKKVALTGEQSYRGNKIVHYDLENGIAFYTGSCGHHATSFKQGPLRALQYALVRDVLRGLRANKDEGVVQELLGLPGNTVLKLHALQAAGLSGLSEGELGDLADSYKFFIHQYHTSQKMHREYGADEVHFDAKEVKSRLESLTELASRPLVQYES